MGQREGLDPKDIGERQTGDLKVGQSMKNKAGKESWGPMMNGQRKEKKKQWGLGE